MILTRFEGISVNFYRISVIKWNEISRDFQGGLRISTDFRDFKGIIGFQDKL